MSRYLILKQAKCGTVPTGWDVVGSRTDQFDISLLIFIHLSFSLDQMSMIMLYRKPYFHILIFNVSVPFITSKIDTVLNFGLFL